MEYGIYFNNNSANENILAAITELENIFFIKNSSSDNKKSTSDNEEVEVSSNNSNDIENLEENFKKMRLNNFEFTENNDNYIKDKVYDDKIGYEQFLTHWLEFECLDKNMRDMAIKGQLMAFQNTNNRKTSRFKYCFNSNLPICHTTYEVLVGVVYKNEYGTEAHVIAESTFRKIWKLLIPSLQFMTPKSDLKLEIQYITEHEKKLAITEKYLNHLNRAKQKRDYYSNNIKCAVEDGKRNPNTTRSQILFKSFEGSAHIAYDWAQNVQIPYSP
ncbi:hypothetical protein GLOIN_2v1838883 [Rhizophagus clarus]|uniref:Uncharacterized protein n=1 Tax=Rhizophagus clarus TaxID=94130 RepID=A0A8H3QEU8_9GLOM|nr:hypothetical protein GLOIN_2v1838883 [Rhizophagus clarus]